MMKNNPWKELTQDINFKRCDPLNKFDFFWGLNQNKEYLFLLEHKNFEDWPNKKLSFNEIEIEQYQLQSGFRILLTLKMLNDWDIFYTLCDDILSLSKEIDDEKVLLTAMHNRLQRWQKMFRKTGKKLLTEQEQQGLMGELFFLKEYLFNHYSSPLALSFWRGPIGDKQDFGIGNTSIEVKTKLGTTSSEVHISSIEQLNFQTKSAYLFVLTLNKSEENSYSLSSLINSIKELIEDYESIELFESLLLEMGYIELPEYNERFYAFIKNMFYEVDDNFPRLTFSNTPSGISSIKYTIDLNTCSKNILEEEKVKERIFNV
ncbi:PD-(D/E)XK motif protein [Halarcobacter sp.]|uniref:PD-(D/E)XK motif protein n=1 Tax=Halarcobacter sp. TaxID=2321133 RepID=UPI002AA5E80D|nr:PD-(D/E)XK motif protein [Halarcobacter sp.]